MTEDGTVVGYGNSQDYGLNKLPGGFQFKGPTIPRGRPKAPLLIEHLTVDDMSEEKVGSYG